MIITIYDSRFPDSHRERFGAGTGNVAEKLGCNVPGAFCSQQPGNVRKWRFSATFPDSQDSPLKGKPVSGNRHPRVPEVPKRGPPERPDGQNAMEWEGSAPVDDLERGQDGYPSLPTSRRASPQKRRLANYLRIAVAHRSRAHLRPVVAQNLDLVDSRDGTPPCRDTGVSPMTNPLPYSPSEKQCRLVLEGDSSDDQR